ncbi:MAG: SMP-30/gluconolactonase/LRE family protein [Proteobacteria bacterium]|nr:SMP-30/gluconolactonase/LRE family protein [Pseudomonadota bacterium]
MDRSTTTLVDGLAFAEGPRWHDGRLFFSDMHRDRVMAVDADGRLEEIAHVEGQPSGLGWLPDGRLLVVSMTDRRLLRLDPGGLSEAADLSGLAAHPCNDMVVDAQGRAYVGHFGYDMFGGGSPAPASLILVQPDGEVGVAADELQFPNGVVITPDGGTLIVGESMGARLTAFDVAADGSLSNRRVWAALEGAVPDGICLDAEGAVWVASPMSSEVLRVAEGGEVLARVPTDQLAIACMLGGDDRRTLFILTTTSVEREECQAQRPARIETVTVEVPGAGLP